MANPPDFRDLDRQKNNKALQFASFDEKLKTGKGSRVGYGQPPFPSSTPTPTISPSPSETPIIPSPTPSISITPSNNLMHTYSTII